MTTWVPYRSDAPSYTLADIDTQAWGNELGGSGGVWGKFAGVFSAAGGQFIKDIGATGNYADVDTGASVGDQRVSVVMAAAGGFCGFIFGFQDANNFYVAIIGGGANTVIYKRVSGTFTAIATGTILTPGQTGRITLEAGTIQFEINGSVDIAAFADTTYASGSCGIYGGDLCGLSNILIEVPAVGGVISAQYVQRFCGGIG